MFQVDIHSHLALLNLGVSDLRAAPERFAPAVVTIPFPQMWGAQVLGYLWCWAEGFGPQMGTAREGLNNIMSDLS